MICGFAYLKYRQTPVVVNLWKRPAVPLLALILCVTFYSVFQWRVGNYYDYSGALLSWIHTIGPAPAFAIVVFAFACTSEGGVWSKLLANRVMIYLGEISFALYLIHQPVLRVIERIQLADAPNSVFWIIGAALCLSLAASVVLFHLVEVPARKFILNSGQHRGALSRFSSFLVGGRQLLFGRAGLTALCLILAGVAMVRQGEFNYLDSKVIQQKLSESAGQFRNVQFDQDAVLLGLTVTPRPDDSKRLELVWKLKTGRRPTRFVHICDAQGKILRHGDTNRHLFENVAGDTTVLDSVLLTAEELADAETIFVGFYCPDRKSAPIFENGVATRKRRLKVMQLSSETAISKAPKKTYLR